MSDEPTGSPPSGGGGESRNDLPLVPKMPPPRPKVGDSMPDPGGESKPAGAGASAGAGGGGQARRRRRRGRGGGGGGGQPGNGQSGGQQAGSQGQGSQNQGGRNRQGGGGGQGGGGQGGGQKGGGQRRRGEHKPIEALLVDEDGGVDLDEKTLKQRSGRQRKGRAVGRYQMNVHVDEEGQTHIAVLEGRHLIEHFVSRPADDISQIHGNIYLGRVENVLPGMEAAFVDIATPKNAVLYRGDVHYDPEDVDKRGGEPRIEDVLKARQLILCQVTKNPIGHKGARLTQEVSLPGRFVVLVPNSNTVGISKRLPDNERKRLRGILDKVRPDGHGIIVRTAAESITAAEIERDVARLVTQWDQIAKLAEGQNQPRLLYREPDMSVRVIREEFNTEYRAVVIDDPKLFEDVHDYVAAISPALGSRVTFYDTDAENLSLFERFQVIEQLKKGLDRKVWLVSGGSLIIEHTEALTVIDVNTGRNVGASNLEDTVFQNNLEAAVEIARQLRLRDIGGIIVVDFVDMEIRQNRDELVRVFKDALSRDKTRTQVFNVSELGLVEMTRKRIGEGLLESFADRCAVCEGRGVVLSSKVIELS